VLYQGGCHCGNVRFKVESSDTPKIEGCNFSIFSKSGFLHLIVPKRDFKLISGKNYLQIYQFNTGITEHTFCKVCGIKPFYIPRSNPDGVDVNIRCLDSQTSEIKIIKFDGKKWEKHAHSLIHKSI